MKLGSIIFICVCAWVGPAQAANENLSFFLKSSLIGAGAGAGAGAVALTTSDRPSENLNMVARGTSLGLYVGMAYGLYRVSQHPDPGVKADTSNFWIAPLTNESLAGGYSFEF